MNGWKSSIPQPAALFGYGGALPFIVAALVLWTLPENNEGGFFGDHGNIIGSMTGLAAVLLSFMGGVRWGLAMQSGHGPTFLQLSISVAPALFAWLVFFLEFLWGGKSLTVIIQLSMLIVAFAGLLVVDLDATRRGEAPDWYPGLRIPLTCLVEASLIATLVRVVLYGELE